MRNGRCRTIVSSWLASILVAAVLGVACGSGGTSCKSVCEGSCGAVSGCDCGVCDTERSDAAGDVDAGDGDATADRGGDEAAGDCAGEHCGCTPDCEGKECGDDGCGGSCGDCPAAAPVCDEGICEIECVPSCDGRECGSNGCDGSCGQCKGNEVCLDDGTCLCQAKCGESKCGDDGCGGSCGNCPGMQDQCIDGNCVCTPACEGKQCGNNGCGEQCGTCPVNHVCTQEGTCLCVPECALSNCGNDGCGGSCGSCGCGEMCFSGTCDFTACDGKDCGNDGCGSSCGSCAAGAACVAGLCPPPGKQCEDFNEVPFDGCNGGTIAEFQANTFFDGDQKRPSVAALDGETFVVVWQSMEQDGQAEGVYAIVCKPSGEGCTDEIQVNSESWGAQRNPVVAPVPGGFAVAWTSSSQDGFLEGVFARVFDLDGTSVTDEIQVNVYTQLNQTDPAIAFVPGAGSGNGSGAGSGAGAGADSGSGAEAGTGGGVAVLWVSDGQDTSGTGVYGRLLDPTGAPITGEIPVNAEILANQGMPSIAGLQSGPAPTDGGFVAAWASIQQDTSDWGLFARRFLPDGSKDWQELQVNTYVKGNQTDPSVAGTGASTYVITWSSFQQDGTDLGVYAQRFKTPGTKQGPEILVNSTKAHAEARPAAAGEPGGRFVIAWEALPAPGETADLGQDGSGAGIFLQRFKSDGAKSGGEASANTFTVGDQSTVSAAMFPGGAFVLAWQSCPAPGAPEQAQDGSACGVYVQRFSKDGAKLYL